MQAMKEKSTEVLRNGIKAENGTGKTQEHHLLNGQQSKEQRIQEREHQS